jgi:imidazole glycerol phosphate synthase glutamine amidotransferase subunit
MIGIIKYRAGNIFSVMACIKKIGKDCYFIEEGKDIEKAEYIILPGVGNFAKGIEFLNKNGLTEKIKEKLKEGIPFLGICLGLQLLFEFSEEGNKRGMNILKGKVIKFKNINLKIPHMGWNKLEILKGNRLLYGISENSYFYFAHSYYVLPEENDIIYGKTEYGIKFPSLIIKKNIVGVQFHPEKSGEKGLKFIKNFLEKKWLQ